MWAILWGAEFWGRTDLNGPEVGQEDSASPSSIVFGPAENRMHTINAESVATMGT
jgi:ornithine carbamoyltransferase